MGRPDASAVIAALVAPQYGVFHRDQARAKGVTDHQIARLVTIGRLRRVLPAVFHDVAVPVSWPQRLKAAELWAGESGCICMRSAAAWWGLEGISFGSIDVYTHKKPPHGVGLIAHRTINLTPDDMRTLRGLRVTKVERSIVDMAGLVTHRCLEAAAHDAFRRRLTIPARMRESLLRAGSNGRRGAREIKSLLTDVEACSSFFGSTFEIIVRDILLQAGLPEPVRQFPISDGKVTIHPDLCYPEARIAIEADGFSCHGTKEAFYRDRWRDNFLRKQDWDFYRATWWDTKQSGELTAWAEAKLFPVLT